MEAAHSAEDLLAAMRALPLATLDDLVGRDPVFVLAPHPDDETLGCGGLIAAARARGQDVHLWVLSDGAGSHPGSVEWPPHRLAALRAREASAAAEALGVPRERLGFLGYRDGALPHGGPAFEQLAKTVADPVRRSGARTVLTTWMQDAHPDHKAAAAVAEAACAETGARLLCFPVWAWMHPPSLPAAPCGWRFEMKRQLAAKRLALAAHASQVTLLIKDAPGGVRLSPEFLAHFIAGMETFLSGGPSPN